MRKFALILVLTLFPFAANAQFATPSYHTAYAVAATNMSQLGQLFKIVMACTSYEPRITLGTRLQEAAANALRSPVLDQKDLSGLVHFFYSQPALSSCPVTVKMPTQDETNLMLAAMVARITAGFER